MQDSVGLRLGVETAVRYNILGSLDKIITRRSPPPVVDADWDMSHRTLKIALILGLVLSLALWALSYFHVSYRCSAGQRFYGVSVSRGCFVLGGAWADPISPSQSGWRSAGFFTQLQTDWTPRYYNGERDWLGLQYGTWSIRFPFWIPVAALGFLLVLYRGLPRLRLLKRIKSSLCARCGYDLRGSTERCPECGTEFISNN